MRTAVLFLATLTTGMAAGVYVHWSSTIMPGLGDLDDRTFVTTEQSLDTAIFNPLFLGVQVAGSLLLIILAVALHVRSEHRTVPIWIGVALVCYFIGLLITGVVHEPLNLEVRDAKLDGDADYAAIRARFDEAKWATWNTVRALVTTIAFGCLAWALAIHRRSSPTPGQRPHRWPTVG